MWYTYTKGKATASSIKCCTALSFDNFLFDLGIYVFNFAGLRVSRKVVWVTGASRGIGAAIAVRLARYGTKVVLSSRDETRLHRVKELCVEAGARPLDVLVLPLDILKHDTHSKALLSVLEHFKKVIRV